MSEENKPQVPEEVVAFKLVQHFTMQGESSYDDFQNRVTALKLIAQKLDQFRQMEVRFAEQERYIEQLESELDIANKLTPTSSEVLDDIDSLTE